jgi:predicted Zn-dependent protease with MMP-like domain
MRSGRGRGVERPPSKSEIATGAEKQMERIQFTQLVDEALARLPKVFKDKIENLAVIVEDYPDKETQGNFSGIILGLFHGVPRTQQSVSWAALPSQIYLYQKNIESICRNDEEITRQIQKTLEHEIGHYFGLSERDLRRRGY